MARVRSWMMLLAWTGALGTGTWWFHRIGETGLAAPPWRPDELTAWLATTEPTLATMALLRLIVLALSWYLVGVTTVGGVARVAGVVRLVRLADALTLPVVRRGLQSALGIGLATAMVAAATPARAQPLPLQLLESAEAAPAPAPAGAPDAVDDDGRGDASPTPHTDGAASVAETIGDEHVVAAGESFWRIAAEFLEQTSGSRPRDVDVVVYWRRLIDHNRHRLADPGNADLLFPGQRLVLPAVE